ncbi:FAD/NAD(P)-binding protein [uncultured Shewanella sp.]|uniref:FAD-dependent oxidoreductase n=1 Tax=uncultured Shewanella sp. TaxID=173975 RepID=UPI00261587B5|nr:FAD/NAD(P)-binding protein [uncultured Shewanella sp.]
MKSYDKSSQVSIIGGGVSGLYSAWRLLKSGHENVKLFEATAHLGGRLMTVDPKNLLRGEYDGQLNVGAHCELGGMRLPSKESYDTYALSLVDELKRSLIDGLEQYNAEDKREAETLILGLTTVDFPTDEPQNWHYLRGFVQQTADLNNHEKYGQYKNGGVPYTLSINEKKLITQNLGMSGPMGYAIEGAEDLSILSRPLIDKDKLPNSTDRKNKLFEFVKETLTNTVEINGAREELYQYGFSDIVNVSGQFDTPQKGSLSNQYWQLFSEAGGYDTVPASWNAATAASIIGLDFAGSPKYKTLAGGLRTIPASLAFLINQFDPDCVEKEAVANRIVYDEMNEEFDLTFTQHDKLINVITDSVVLAMPPAAIEKLIGGQEGIYSTERLNDDSVIESQRLIRQKLTQVTPIPLLKIYLMYDITGRDAWWEKYVGKIEQYSRMTTDLPLRQIYNFGVYDDHFWMEGQQTRKYAVLQISYDDDLNPGYWAGLLSKESGGVVDTGIFGDAFTQIGQKSYSSVMPLVKRFNSQHLLAFKQDHPLFSTAHEQFVNIVKQVANRDDNGEPVSVKGVTLPTAGACMDWGVAPYGGGVNFWNVGVDVAKEYWTMMRPYQAETNSKDDKQLYIVGEGYSIFQGWIEGALWTAEAVLEDYFDLNEEPWMPFNVSENLFQESHSHPLVASSGKENTIEDPKAH